MIHKPGDRSVAELGGEIGVDHDVDLDRRDACVVAPDRGHEIYAPYWAKADAIGFDLYPLEKLCSHRLTLRNVYDIQRQLVQENPGKPTYQWIETGPLEGECFWSPFRVTPATLQAEAWMAIAGGAAGIGYFTHTWRANGTPEPSWSPFDVAALGRAVRAVLDRSGRIVLLHARAAVTMAGDLLLYPGRGNGTLASGRKIGSGWSVWTIGVGESRAKASDIG